MGLRATWWRFRGRLHVRMYRLLGRTGGVSRTMAMARAVAIRLVRDGRGPIYFHAVRLHMRRTRDWLVWWISRRR